MFQVQLIENGFKFLNNKLPASCQKKVLNKILLSHPQQHLHIKPIHKTMMNTFEQDHPVNRLISDPIVIFEELNEPGVFYVLLVVGLHHYVE